MVYGSIHSTLTLRARVRISPSPRHFCPSAKAIYPHCCSRPRCINGDPVGCDSLLCLNLPAPLSQAAIPGKDCSRRGVEIVHCKCGIEMYPMTGVIIAVSALSLTGKARIKMSYYCSYYYLL